MLRFFDKTFVTKVLVLALLYSLVPLAEIFLLIYLGDRIGNYITLALAAATGLAGMLIALRSFQKNLTALKEKIRKGVYPGEEFINVAGILVGAILLLTPGFITDCLGLLLFVPGIRQAVGALVLRATGTSMKELYEYLKLYD